MTGWISRLAVIRILISAIHEYQETFKASTNPTEYEAVPVSSQSAGRFTAIEMAQLNTHSLVAELTSEAMRGK
jgi:hypothetical protein